jgi:hypothetical protein
MRLRNFELPALLLAASCAIMTGCATQPPPSQRVAERVENPAAGIAERPSNLSYGAVTATVKKSVTTQAELIEIFGGPNISTTDASGLETWVYERTSSTSDTAGSQDSKNLEAFFGAGGTAGPVALGGGVSGGTRSSNDARRTVNSVRTLTVVVKFNPDKTVKDCSVRASYF